MNACEFCPWRRYTHVWNERPFSHATLKPTQFVFTTASKMCARLHCCIHSDKWNPVIILEVQLLVHFLHRSDCKLVNFIKGCLANCLHLEFIVCLFVCFFGKIKPDVLQVACSMLHSNLTSTWLCMYKSISYVPCIKCYACSSHNSQFFLLCTCCVLNDRILPSALFLQLKDVKNFFIPVLTGTKKWILTSSLNIECSGFIW